MTHQEHIDPPSKIKNRLNVLPENPEISDPSKAVGVGRFPSWLHRKLHKGNELLKTASVINNNRLHTVCEEAKCPNLLECWSKKTATFLILGKECTRGCSFCDIDFTKQPKSIDNDEPKRVADSILQLGLRHAVITMVARDDLPDGGAAQLADVIKEIRKRTLDVTIEVLTSDFEGNENALNIVLDAKPEIFNHNIETVRDLTPKVRHKATYERTLQVLRYVKRHAENFSLYIKSGIMVGLGETEEQVFETLKDLKEVGCDIVTIGQYLQPNKHKLRIKSFVQPTQFKKYENYGHSIGIKYMYCGPFIRSSYNADMVLKKIEDKS